MVTIIRKKCSKHCYKSTIISVFKTHRHVGSINIGSDDSKINPSLSPDELRLGTRLGLDSHADTSCVNKHAYVESVVEGITVDAIPFDESIGKMSDLPIVHAIYAYDDTHTFRTILVRINNAIYIKDMKNALLCPNQAREHGTIIDDIPQHLDHTGSSTFSVEAEDYSFPLQRHGPTAFIQMRRPTQEELDHCPIVDITDEDEWDPYKMAHISAINSLTNTSNTVVPTSVESIDDWLLYSNDRQISALQVTRPKDKLTPEYLA